MLHTNLWNFGRVGLQVLLQLLYLAPHSGVNGLICLDGFSWKQLCHQCVVCLARLHRCWLNAAAAR